MQNDIVNGVEKIEFGIPGLNGALPTSWTRFENIEDGSVSYTSNQDSKTSITPEDKDTPIITLYTPGDGDVFNFGLLEISPENLQALFNVNYDPATSTITILSQKKYANLAVRLTTRPQMGVKKIFTYRNCQCEVSYNNNFTKNALVSIRVAATIYSFKLGDGVTDALYTIQKVLADGSTIDATPSFDTTIDFTSDASPAAVSGVTATIGATNSTVKFKFNAIDSPSGTPENMVLHLGSSDVASIDFPSDYAGEIFQYIDSAGDPHSGVFTNGTVTLT